MFDMFGLSEQRGIKVGIEAMAKGVTAGLLDAYESKLMEKNDTIERLNKKIEDLENELTELKENKKK